LQQLLAATSFAPPRPPFFSATDCDFVDAAGLPGMLARQMTAPVRWRQSVERLIAGGTDLFIEVGSGKVLCGLIRRINRDVQTIAVADGEGIEKALRAMENARG
jgi:[acyl-carrier-protein] S-malonyltransferase